MNKLQNVFKTHKKGFLTTLVFLMLVLIVGVSCVFGIKGKEDSPKGSEVVAETITPRNSGKWTDEGNYATSFAGGTGTETNPYLISNGAQLAKVASDVNTGTTYQGKYFKMTSDIDLLDFYWTPIGTQDKPFYGNFNGGFFTVSGLVIEGVYEYAGLFGYITSTANNITIENLTLYNSRITEVGDIDFCVGGIVGGFISTTNSISFINVCNYATITVENSGYAYAGGIAGYIGKGSLLQSYNMGDVNVTTLYSSYVGGLVGNTSDVTITNSYNNASVKTSYTGEIKTSNGSQKISRTLTYRIYDSYRNASESEVTEEGNTSWSISSAKSYKKISMSFSGTIKYAYVRAVQSVYKYYISSFSFSGSSVNLIVESSAPRHGLWNALVCQVYVTYDDDDDRPPVPTEKTENGCKYTPYSSLSMYSASSSSTSERGTVFEQTYILKNITKTHSFSKTAGQIGFYTVSDNYGKSVKKVDIDTSSTATTYPVTFSFDYSNPSSDVTISYKSNLYGPVQSASASGTASVSVKKSNNILNKKINPSEKRSVAIDIKTSGNLPFQYAGGLIGSATKSTIKNSFNIGSVTSANSGGIVGYSLSTTISNTYHINTKSIAAGTATMTAVGKVTNLAVLMKRSYKFKTSSFGSYTNDSGSTGSAVWSQAWNFNNVWIIEPSLNNQYPTYVQKYTKQYWIQDVASSFSSGSGTSSSPYLISTPQQLIKLSSDVCNGTYYEGKYFKLKNNIDLSGKLWTPIGTNKTDVFAGNFDGAGFEITGMTIEGDYAYAGLFGRCAKTNSTIYTIQNIKLSNVNLNVNETSGTTYNVRYGPLIGSATSNSVIKNCEILSGNITPVLNHAGCVGGLIGYVSNATIDGCTNNITVNAKGPELYVGGLVGEAYTATISNSYNYGENIATTTVTGIYQGGIVGRAHTTTILKSANFGNITSTANGVNYVGGISGEVVTKLEIIESYNQGIIDGTGVTGIVAVGGLVGFVNASTVSITNSYNTASIKGISNESYAVVGGLIAYSAGSVSISVEHCYNIGSVSAQSETFCEVGGLFGGANSGDSIDINFVNCFSSTSLTGSSTSGANRSGGLSGSGITGLVFSNCYFDSSSFSGGAIHTSGTTENLSNSGKVASLSNLMKIPKNYGTAKFGTYTDDSSTSGSAQWSSAWDFENIWFMEYSLNGQYPMFKREVEGKYWLQEKADSFAGGTGTETDPYLISTPQQLAKLSYDVYNRNPYTGKYFKLTNDIDLTEKLWTPIGGIVNSYDLPFSGNLDGNNHIIKGMTIDGDYIYAGLVGRLDGESEIVIKDIGVTESNITINRSGVSYSGGLIGLNNDSIKMSKCYYTGSIFTNSLDSYSGGLIGGSIYSTTMIECYNTGNISGVYSGGLIGATDCNLYLLKCYNTGNISGTETGGLIGTSLSLLKIDICYNLGNISGGVCGGLIGSNSSKAVINNCYNKGNLNATDVSGYVSGYAGGLIARNFNELSITNSFAECSISGATNLGGLIAESSNSVKIIINSCYFKGNIETTTSTADSNYAVGGLIGYLNCLKGSEINDCYVIATIKAYNLSSISFVKGFIGYNSKPDNITISNYYASADITYSGGTSTSKVYNGTFASDKWFYHDNFHGGELTLKSIYLIGKGVDTTAEQNLARLTNNGFTQSAA